MSRYPRVRPFGEGALLIEFGAVPTRDNNARAHALAAVLAAAPPAGLVALIPSYASLLVRVDPLADDCRPTVEAALAALATAPGTPAGRVRRVPVLYGAAHGPDLAALAAELGLSPRDVIAAHTAAEQRVYMLGFAPGLPYIGDASPALAGLRRLATPRTRVPRGAIGIVGQQTVVYPRSTPGGWRIIGQTPIEIWDETRPAPAYFRPNDRVQFESIALADWDDLVGLPADW